MNVSPQLTANGWSLLTRAIAGASIAFTEIKVGSGEVNVDPATLNDLVTPVYTLGIESIDTSVAQQVVVKGRFDSSQIPNDFVFREVGLFCGALGTEDFVGTGAQTSFQLPALLTTSFYPYSVTGVTINGTAYTGTASYNNQTGVLTLGTAPASGAAIEVTYIEKNMLYAYMNYGDDAGTVAKQSAIPREFILNIAVVIGEASSVTAIITAAQAYASQEDLDALDSLLASHVSNTSNPHQVTAAQLGLSNVAAPTYTPNTTSSALTPGESIANALKKISGHIADKNNPHEVTLAQTSGVLPISKGGTGKSTEADLKALIQSMVGGATGGSIQVESYTGNDPCTGFISNVGSRLIKTFPSAPKFVFIWRYFDGYTGTNYSNHYLQLNYTNIVCLLPQDRVSQEPVNATVWLSTSNQLYVHSFYMKEGASAAYGPSGFNTINNRYVFFYAL